MDPARVQQSHPFQRGREGRPLCGLGTAKALHGGTARGIQIAAQLVRSSSAARGQESAGYLRSAALLIRSVSRFRRNARGWSGCRRGGIRGKGMSRPWLGLRSYFRYCRRKSECDLSLVRLVTLAGPQAPLTIKVAPRRCSISAPLGLISIGMRAPVTRTVIFPPSVWRAFK